MKLLELEKALLKYFGFKAFRPEQDHIVSAVADGRDVLGIMPTGGGKSLCYQLPALVREGVALIVSPLISLMKDQIDTLHERGIAATFINSSIGAGEQSARIRGMVDGSYRMVYVAPERFRSKYFREQLASVKISFVAVDEAHCVSQWGHDFRPDYLRIGQFIRAMGQPQICAFTATATPHVRKDIVEFLDLKDPKVFVTGFARPNLAFQVFHADKRADKFARISQLISKNKKGIIYCSTRKKVDEVAERLEGWDISYVAYHAGMDENAREAAQNQFMRGEVDVAVATNAFGMGIDRSDIRFVAHFDLPGSVEAYYQEAGRAGRDGLPSVCELLFNYADRTTQDFFIDGANPPVSTIHELYAYLRSQAGDDGTILMSIDEICKGMGLRNGMQVSSSLKLLVDRQYIERYDIPGQRVRGTRIADMQRSARDLEFDEAAIGEKRRRDEEKLESIISYAGSAGCRQVWIQHFFGEKNCQPCETCDECQRNTSTAAKALDQEQWVTLQKLLSGVARMSLRGGPEGWEPQYGKALVIQMLTGSEEKRILKFGLQRLTTYGILRREGKTFVRELIDECLRRGYLKTTGGLRPLITLTPMGEAVMKRDETPIMHWPATVVSTVNAKPLVGRPLQWDEAGHDPDTDLMQLLKHKRIEIARARNVPAYQILTNKVLDHLASSQPITREEALAIPGIGEVKARTTLPAFLNIIAHHRSAKRE